MKRALVFATAMLAFTTAAQAAPDWTVLGFKTVGRGSDRDVITVNPGPTYRKLQLCAFNAPITLEDFDATYGNGTTENFAVRSVIRAGTCTRDIDLRGGDRHLTRIDLRYAKLRPRSRAPLVRVMGR